MESSLFFFHTEAKYILTFLNKTHVVEFFRNKPQQKNANIANFVLVMPLENNCSNGEYNFKTTAILSYP